MVAGLFASAVGLSLDEEMCLLVSLELDDIYCDQVAAWCARYGGLIRRFREDPFLRIQVEIVAFCARRFRVAANSLDFRRHERAEERKRRSEKAKTRKMSSTQWFKGILKIRK